MILININKLIIAILLLLPATIAHAGDHKSRFGFGFGPAYAGIGARYDIKIVGPLLFSANIGAGYNVGASYHACTNNEKTCVTGSFYYGESIRGIGDSTGLDSSSSIGLSMERYFSKTWSFEIGAYYLKFLENTGPEYDDDDGFRLSLGFNRKFN